MKAIFLAVGSQRDFRNLFGQTQVFTAGPPTRRGA